MANMFIPVLSGGRCGKRKMTTTCRHMISWYAPIALFAVGLNTSTMRAR